MLKTITRQLFARLNRHLPYRLVHRDPLPGAQTAVNATIPPSLSERCLKVAAMEQETLWRVFDTHPEGLNAAPGLVNWRGACRNKITSRTLSRKELAASVCC